MKLNNKIRKNVENLIRKSGIDPQTIDIDHEYDNTLTYQENKTQFIEKFNLKAFEPNKSDEKLYNEEINKLEEEHIETIRKEQLEQYRKQLKYTKTDDFYKQIYDAVLKLKMGLRSLIFVKGRPGIGKSWHIRKALVLNDLEFVSISGRISEAHLYQTLYENNGKIIWFKDVMRLFTGLHSIEMLKSACETNPEDRILSNYTYSKELNKLPRQFLWKGKIIFDYNQFIGRKYSDDFNALVSRGELIELVFSFDEMCQIMRSIAKTKKEKEITEFLIDNYNFIGTNQFNLRTQQDAFVEYKFAKAAGRDWKEHIKNYLKKNMSPVRSFLYQFMGRHPVKAVELKKFLVLTGNVQTVRTAERRISEWLELEEIYKVSSDLRNPLLSLYPINIEITDISDKMMIQDKVDI